METSDISDSLRETDISKYFDKFVKYSDPESEKLSAIVWKHCFEDKIYKTKRNYKQVHDI